MKKLIQIEDCQARNGSFGVLSFWRALALFRFLLIGAVIGGVSSVAAAVPEAGSASEQPAASLHHAGTGRVTWFRLAPVPEGNSLGFMRVARQTPPQMARGIDSRRQTARAPDGGRADVAPGKVSEQDLAAYLAADRKALRAELKQLTQQASASPLPAISAPVATDDAGGDAGGSDKGPEGAVRELSLDGFPKSVVDEIMQRYHLNIVTKEIRGGRTGDSFLSSASRGPNEHYFGGLTVPEGVYEVFQLNRETVALMSRLEEDALKQRGLEPLKTRISHIVFGIVKSDDGHYELGVKSLKADRVAP